MTQHIGIARPIYRASARSDGATATQGVQDEIGARRHTDLRQDDHLVAEGRVKLEQTLILGYRRTETMASLSVVNEDFGPRRRKNIL
jgi:hypothetical protein